MKIIVKIWCFIFGHFWTDRNITDDSGRTITYQRCLNCGKSMDLEQIKIKKNGKK